MQHFGRYAHTTDRSLNPKASNLCYELNAAQHQMCKTCKHAKDLKIYRPDSSASVQVSLRLHAQQMLQYDTNAYSFC